MLVSVVVVLHPPVVWRIALRIWTLGRDFSEDWGEESVICSAGRWSELTGCRFLVRDARFLAK